MLDGTYSLNYTTGAALASAGYESVFVSLEVLGADYYIPYYPAMGADDGYRVQTSDVLYSSGTGIRGNLYSRRVCRRRRGVPFVRIRGVS